MNVNSLALTKLALWAMIQIQTPPVLAQMDGSPAAGIRAKTSAIRTLDMSAPQGDLLPFKQIIGPATVVGLGESDHGLHKIPRFRNRLFKFLVERMNFRAIAIETGVLEAQIADRYIQGETIQGQPEITLNMALNLGITHGMGPWEEMKDLLEWLREYNSQQKDPKKKVHFFGFDLPVVGDAPIVPLTELGPFIKEADASYYNTTFSRLLELSEKAYAVTKILREATKQMVKSKKPKIDLDSVEIDPDFLDAYGTIGFDQLTPAEQKTLESGVLNLIDGLKHKRKTYVRQSSIDKFEWNLHLAEIAAQHIRNLRSRQKTHKVFAYATAMKHLKMVGILDLLNIDPSYDLDMKNRADIILQLKGRSTRELMAAENVQWAQKRYGKVFIYAHHGHLLKTRVDVKVGAIEIGKEGGESQGLYIAEMYGPNYVVISASVGTMVDAQGKVMTKYGGTPFEPTQTCKDCVEAAYVELPTSLPAYLTRWSALDAQTQNWLSQDHAIRWQGGFQRLNAREAFDAFMYFTVDQPGLKLP